MQIFTPIEGDMMVKASRSAIELFLKSRNFNKKMVNTYIEGINKSAGVFVTIYHYPTRTLRGNMGFPKPIGSIQEDLIDASIAAAFEDSRFVQVSHLELEHMIIQVSLIFEMEQLKGIAAARKKSIALGEDGLYMEYGLHSSILLPQSAIEYGYTKERMLEELCIRAGVNKNYWMQKNVKVFKFKAQVFEELEPSGSAVEISNKIA